MLFNSLAFAIFLPTVFLIYWLALRSRMGRNLFILAVSYLFYGWWDWRFLLLIALTTACSYISGLQIARAEKKGTSLQRRLWLWGNVGLNLGILILFKYYNFFVNSASALLAQFGITLDSVTLNLILPVGISFYTFQALSYTIDVYRRQIEPTRDIVAFFAFISFFPQLVAGPIERATNLLPQFLRQRSFDYTASVDGCRQILWGLFKKMVVADNCALIANTVFGIWETTGGINLWIGALAFTFQIYGDFSGYSDIAIGTAKLFGINLMRNFNVPYFSRDIAEFWRRWHISLTSWFRDYIYIPLGGSRCSKGKVVRNTFIIFLTSGLWHGANWTFIAWGGYHALLFLPLILRGKNRKYRDTIASGRRMPTMRESTLMAVTFLLVLIGWIIFRSDTISEAAGYIVRMFTDWSLHSGIPGKRYFIWVAVMLVVEWVLREHRHTFDIQGHGLLKYRLVRWGLYLGIACLCIFDQGSRSEFIYFQF